MPEAIKQPAPAGDAGFGQLVVDAGLATQTQIDECLRLKRYVESRGETKRLSDVMVQMGYVTREEAEKLLATQQKRILVCTKCHTRHEVPPSAEAPEKCRSCGGPLEQEREPGPADEGADEGAGGGDDSSDTDGRTGRKLDPTNLIGETLRGCKIVKRIAVGGMGTIYKGVQVMLNRPVAIKVLSPDLSGDKAYVQRFLLEASAAAELNHPNLIHVMDAGCCDGVFYYMMEYVPGEDCDTILTRDGRMPVDKAIAIVIQAARALEHAHKHGIVHRDIKPGNLMIMKDGLVKIADLGIAKKTSFHGNVDLTEAGMVLGTPYYMPPEQARDSRSVDHRSDIYALGATFYHILTGCVPFDGENVVAVLVNVIEKNVSKVTDLNPAVPASLGDVISKMMAKMPERRYQSMTEVIEALETERAAFSSRNEKPPAKDLAKPAQEKGPPPAKPAPQHPKGAPVKSVRHSPPREQAARPEPLPVPLQFKPPPAPVFQTAEPGSVRKILVPVAIILAAAIVGYIGWRVLTRMDAGHPNTPNSGGVPGTDGGPKKNPFGGDGPGDPSHGTGLIANKDGQRLLDEAVQFHKESPECFLEVRQKYYKIFTDFPGTVAGDEAQKKFDEITKTIDKRSKERLAAIDAKMDTAKRTLQFGDAVQAVSSYVRDFEESPWKERGDEKMRNIMEFAGEKLGSELTKAEEFIKVQNYDEAAKMLKPVLNCGVEDFSRRASLKLDCMDMWADDERVISHNMLGASTAELSGVIRLRQFKDALAKMDGWDKRADLKGALDEVARLRQSLTLALRVTEAAKQHLTSCIGTEVAIRFRGSKVRGEVSSVDDDMVVINMGDKPFRIPWANISHEDVLQFADNVLKTDAGQQRLASGAYFMLLGRQDLASEHFSAALAAGVQDAQAYLDDIAEAAITKRITESIVLFDGKSAEKWVKAPGSAWTVDLENESLVLGENKTSLFVESKEFDEYVYSLKAKKLSGLNGFAVPFRAFGRCFTWVLGDTANTESLVHGMPSTLTKDVIETHRWYRVRLVVTKDSASGYLNGVRKWTVDRADTATAEEAPGMGIGAYATKVCFRKIEISMLKAQ